MVKKNKGEIQRKYLKLIKLYLNYECTKYYGDLKGQCHKICYPFFMILTNLDQQVIC